MSKALLYTHKYIFLLVTDIALEVCGQAFHIKRALLAQFIITYNYIFLDVIKYSANLVKIRKKCRIE
jgi:hypothetical protein